MMWQMAPNIHHTHTQRHNPIYDWCVLQAIEQFPLNAWRARKLWAIMLNSFSIEIVLWVLRFRHELWILMHLDGSNRIESCPLSWICCKIKRRETKFSSISPSSFGSHTFPSTHKFNVCATHVIHVDCLFAFFWKMCWWLYYSSFPLELSIPAWYILPLCTT